MNIKIGWLLYDLRLVTPDSRVKMPGIFLVRVFGRVNNIFHWKLQNFGILIHKNVTPVLLTFIAATRLLYAWKSVVLRLCG